MRQAECGFAGQPDALVRFGPTLRVRIGFDPDYRIGGNPNLPQTEYHALVDTGAGESCIDSSIAAAVGLPSIDRVQVSGVHGAGEVNVHLAQMFIPILDLAVSGRFAGVHLHAGGQPHGALIGRALLRHVTMLYNGITGSVSIALPGPPRPQVPAST
ncbi:MAG: aspartyl protease family protein [Defluviicoccus sp.]|nr:aspartyl protease family protein [Defluviicoccus sp.]